MRIDSCSSHLQSAVPGISGAGHVLRRASATPIAIWTSLEYFHPLFLQGMMEGHCDLDILLDPFFLHFPASSEKRIGYPGLGCKTTKIPNLITAYLLADSAEPWRNQYRPRLQNILDHRYTAPQASYFHRDRYSVDILFVQY